MVNRFSNILFILFLLIISISNTFSNDKNKDSKNIGVKYFGSFVESEIGSIDPEGWLREYLNRQAKGLTGNLEYAGFPFNSTGWFDSTMAKYGWVVYEQNAYWVDGMLRCGELIDDTVLINKAMKQINYVLNHADTDGYLGPEFLKAHSDSEPLASCCFFSSING